MPSARVNILEAYKDRIAAAFGPTPGDGRLRRVQRRQWDPEAPVRPMATIHDDGQRFPNLGDEASENLTLNWKCVLDVEGAFERTAKMSDLTDLVQDIIVSVQNFLPSGTGSIQTNYVQDEPFDVVLQNGSIESMWAIEFETEYFDEVGLLGPTN